MVKPVSRPGSGAGGFFLCTDMSRMHVWALGCACCMAGHIVSVGLIVADGCPAAFSSVDFSVSKHHDHIDLSVLGIPT